MKGRIQPFTDLSFSLLCPSYVLVSPQNSYVEASNPLCLCHSSIGKNFGCQALLTLNLSTLLSPYLGPLYPLPSYPSHSGPPFQV